MNSAGLNKDQYAELAEILLVRALEPVRAWAKRTLEQNGCLRGRKDAQRLRSADLGATIGLLLERWDGLNAKNPQLYDHEFKDRLHGIRRVRNRLAHFHEKAYPTFAEFLQDVASTRSFLSMVGADEVLISRLDTLIGDVVAGRSAERSVTPPSPAEGLVSSEGRLSPVIATAGSSSVVGVDGCRAGWLAVERHLGTGEVDMRIYSSFGELLQATEAAALIAIDVPIGLPDRGRPGGRQADIDARRLLSPRGSTVFSASGRNIFGAADFDEARRICTNDGSPLPTKQSFAFLRKIKEVDALMTPKLQERIREIHPELCFLQLNGGRVAGRKKDATGREERMKLLEKAGFPDMRRHVSRFPAGQAVPDDVLDAHAACWTAGRVLHGEAFRIPSGREVDSRGLVMEMWR